MEEKEIDKHDINYLLKILKDLKKTGITHISLPGLDMFLSYQKILSQEDIENLGFKLNHDEAVGPYSDTYESTGKWELIRPNGSIYDKEIFLRIIKDTTPGHHSITITAATARITIQGFKAFKEGDPYYIGDCKNKSYLAKILKDLRFRKI